MAYGLQVWDSTSNLIIDTSTFTSKIVGQLLVTSNTTNVAITVTGSSSEKVWAIALSTTYGGFAAGAPIGVIGFDTSNSKTFYYSTANCYVTTGTFGTTSGVIIYYGLYG